MLARRWQDCFNLALGAWLCLSPAILAYSGTGAAWNAYTIGASIVALSVSAVFMPALLKELFAALLGIWLIVSPFVLQFDAMRVVALHSVLAGILIVSFAMWAGFGDDLRYERWLRRHSA
jgi:hypothetical protein